MAATVTAPPTALLALTDGRFPGGGHAHSGGLEPAAADGLVDDVESLRTFLVGRLATTGLVESAFAAWVVAHAGSRPTEEPSSAGGAQCAGGVEALDWRSVDDELTARITMPALRRTSRQRGRQMARAVRRIWPGRVEALLAAAPPDGPHAALALAAAAVAAELAPLDAAVAAAYDAVTMPATAAVRLMGLDPFAVQRVVVELGSLLDATARRAVSLHTVPLEQLPSGSAPMADIHAERHATWEVRLFAS